MALEGQLYFTPSFSYLSLLPFVSNVLRMMLSFGVLVFWSPAVQRLEGHLDNSHQNRP